MWCRVTNTTNNLIGRCPTVVHPHILSHINKLKTMVPNTSMLIMSHDPQCWPRRLIAPGINYNNCYEVSREEYRRIYSENNYSISIAWNPYIMDSLSIATNHPKLTHNVFQSLVNKKSSRTWLDYKLLLWNNQDIYVTKVIEEIVYKIGPK